MRSPVTHLNWSEKERNPRDVLRLADPLHRLAWVWRDRPGGPLRTLG